MKVHTSNDRSDAAGLFAVRVVAGSYGITVRPPTGEDNSDALGHHGGLVQRTIQDHSDALGEFTIMLPDGTLDITFTPPISTGFPPKTVQGVMVSGADMRLPDVVLDNPPPPPPDPALVFVTKEGADVVITWAESPGATRIVSASQQPNVFGAAEVSDANVTTLTYRHAGEISVDRIVYYQVR